MGKTIIAGIVFSITVAAAASVVDSSLPAGASSSIKDTIADDHRLQLFADALRQSGVGGPSGNEKWTLFVPTDEAMRNEGSDFLLGSVLLSPANAERLSEVVSHHMIRGQKLALSSQDGTMVTASDAGHPVKVERIGSGTRVDGYAIVVGRIEARDGVIYLVDRMLWPGKWSGDTAAASSAS